MKDIELTNASGKLCPYRQSRRGVVQDYIISFNQEIDDIQMEDDKTFDLFQQLMERFKDNVVKVRLIAQVDYSRPNDKHEEVGQEDYHFSSYQMEEVFDIQEFDAHHLAKMGSRMDAFHQMEVD